MDTGVVCYVQQSRSSLQGMAYAKLPSQTARLQMVSTGTEFLWLLAEDEGAPPEELTKRSTSPPLFLGGKVLRAKSGARARAPKEDEDEESVTFAVLFYDR